MTLSIAALRQQTTTAPITSATEAALLASAKRIANDVLPGIEKMLQKALERHFQFNPTETYFSADVPVPIPMEARIFCYDWRTQKNYYVSPIVEKAIVNAVKMAFEDVPDSRKIVTMNQGVKENDYYLSVELSLSSEMALR